MDFQRGQPLTVRFERGPLLSVPHFDLSDEKYAACFVAAGLLATLTRIIAVRSIVSFVILDAQGFGH